MGRLLHATIVLTMTALVACGGKGSPPPATPPPSGGGNTITGRERIGWLQSANTPADLALYSYALYVDGARRTIEGESCTATAQPQAFDCSAPLPQMTAGTHTLELASYFTLEDTIYESPRSSPLQVTIAGITAPASSNDVRSGRLISSDGLRLQADILVRDLTDPVDLAVSNEGQVFVAERGGRVRVIDPQETGSSTREDDTLRLPGQPAEASLASIALAPDFSRARAVLVAYHETDRTGSVVRVAKFRETMGVLAQAAVIASAPIAPEASTIARFGPDGALYIGIGSGTDPNSAQNLASASGKILRLKDDGTTPDDNPSRSPIYSSGHSDPRGLVWDPMTGSLWEVERDEGGDEINMIRGGANYGWPIATGQRAVPRVTPAVLMLPAGTQPSGIAAVAAPASPLYGDLIVSAAGAEDVLRIPIGTSRQRRAIGRMLQGRFGRIGQIATSTDGAVFLITNNKEAWGEGHDLLIRLAVAAR